MTVERYSSGTSLIDVLDRVLDKGIVIDAWVRISLVGIDLITVEARIVVASIDTYLRYAEAVGLTAPSARPVGSQRDESLPSPRDRAVDTQADIRAQQTTEGHFPAPGV